MANRYDYYLSGKKGNISVMIRDNEKVKTSPDYTWTIYDKDDVKTIINGINNLWEKVGENRYKAPENIMVGVYDLTEKGVIK